MLIQYRPFEVEDRGEGITYKVEWKGEVWLKVNATSLTTTAEEAASEASAVALAIVGSIPAKGSKRRCVYGDDGEHVEAVEAVEGAEASEGVEAVAEVLAGWRVRVEVEGWLIFEGGPSCDEGGAEAAHGMGRAWLAAVLADEEIDAGRLCVSAIEVLDRTTGKGIRGAVLSADGTAPAT